MPNNNVTTIYQVPSSAMNVTLMAENIGRLALSTYNNSNKKLYIKFGANCTLNSFTTIIPPDGYFALPFTQCYTGRVDGFWEGANGSAMMTEIIS